MIHCFLVLEMERKKNLTIFIHKDKLTVQKQKVYCDIKIPCRMISEKNSKNVPLGKTSENIAAKHWIRGVPLFYFKF